MGIIENAVFQKQLIPKTYISLCINNNRYYLRWIWACILNKFIICSNQNIEEDYGFYLNQKLPISNFIKVECIWPKSCKHISFVITMHLLCNASQYITELQIDLILNIVDKHLIPTSPNSLLMPRICQSLILQHINLHKGI